ncbi:MAG: M3 family oligoendopeptidase [Anaerolineales bacterium]|nr:M3 family oligoendopeptidase [Anaerolineales bacterium]
MSNNGYEIQPWSLEDLYSGFDGPELESAFDELEQKVEDFEDYRDQLTEDIDQAQFRTLMGEYEAIRRLLSRVGAYASLRFAEDTQNQRAQSFMASVRERSAEIENRTLFFKLWWKGLEPEAAERLLEAAGDYRYWLYALRLQTPYTLSESEEKIINIKDVNGPQALVTLYDSITNRYSFELEVEGEVKELTRGQLSRYVRSPDPELRKAAYQELLRVYSDDGPILGQVYQFIARDWYSEHVRLRDYESPISVRNLANDVPDEVVAALLQASRENADVFHRFFELKARWLGMEKLRRYDIYAPVAESEAEYSYPEAIDLVLESYRDFDHEVAELAERVFVEDHIDSEVRPGKRSGAFCATVTPDLTPYVLASYHGEARDVATLAHELGHAVHSMLADHHTALTQHASLPLAETASTFGEMLLVDRMLAQDPDPDVQRDLLFRQLDDNYATIMRQAYFALFEREAHDAIHGGASIDDISAIYMDNLAEQFGDVVEVPEEFKYEWVAIPHFYHSPFYVYAYAFGQLLVLSLYRRFQEEGEAFKPAYLDILRAGGSASPMETLSRADVDVSRPTFWQGGYDVISDMLDRLEGVPAPESP